MIPRKFSAVVEVVQVAPFRAERIETEWHRRSDPTLLGVAKGIGPARFTDECFACRLG
jgi:hypothetical protein